MKRVNVVGFVALVAVALSAMVGTAVAKGPTDLTLKTAKGALATGATLKADSTNLVFVTSAGNLECSSNIIEGTAGTNNAK